MTCASEADVQPAEARSTGQLREHAVGRGENCDLPAKAHEGNRQIPHDVTDTADLAFGQRSVFGRDEDDVFRGDSRYPGFTG
jgi:hypothetical protein